MPVDTKDIFRKKFLFSIFSLAIATLVTMWLKYDGEIYVKLFGTVVVGFLLAQAYVDATSKKKEE